MPFRFLACAAAAVAVVGAESACGSLASRLRPPPSPPPGYTAVQYDKAQIFVPSDWPRNQLRCGTPIQNTVVVDPGPVDACLLGNPPLVSYVWIGIVNNVEADPEASVATQALTINGHAARRGVDRLHDGRTRVVLVVLDRKLVVPAVSMDPKVARQIIDSVWPS